MPSRGPEFCKCSIVSGTSLLLSLSGLLPEAGTWLWHCVTGFPFPLVDITKEQQLVQSAFLKAGKKSVCAYAKWGNTVNGNFLPI